MYDMVDPSRRLKPRFINGVYEFVSKAMEQISYTQDGGIRCPCIKCICEKILKPSLVRAHLLQYGFKPNYKIWVLHGEQGSNEDNLCHASSNYEDMNYVDKFGSIQNKLNQSSTRGRALHSTGRKSHVDIALGLVSTLIIYISLHLIQFSTQYLILLTIFIYFRSINMVDLLSQMNYSWKHTLRRMVLG